MTTSPGGPLADRAGDVLRTDHHTHTDFTDGRDSLERVVAAAESAGLHTLFVTDHVRADSDYLPRYVRALDAAAAGTPVRLVYGVEAKIMDTSGRIDLPPDLTGVRHIALADHRFPLPAGPAHPDTVRELLTDGRLSAHDALAMLVEATCRAVAAVPPGLGAHVAHLFSVLPKCGLEESAVDPVLLARLADACRASGTPVELNEKWRCPGPATALALHRAGVRLVAGSDAHAAEAVGRWSHAAEVLDALPGPGAGSQAS
ncbi:PHP domain-containing protein [Streptomyces sp. ODS28]|uniref:PHP domain-containing protein n=1 Tax=Streptomyces sp. ODS28 TaxID=3136688 RepID=UPI0031E8144E